MPSSLYNFQYVPLTGRLPGISFVKQTEQAINDLAKYVYDNSTNYETVKSIAQKAEEDSSAALEYSEEALDKAQTALETVGRAYIKTTSAVDLDDYFDSELLLILSTESTNLPANISGYLTVMSSDTHDYCMQVYIGIDGSVYKRTATISDNTPTFGAWSETPITLSSLQTILTGYAKVDASNIGVNAQTDNSTAWGNAIGGGEIVNGEQRLVTGDTVYESEYQLEQKVETDIGINDKRITNIEKLLQGNLYDYQTDSDTAYIKSVPSGAMPYAGLEQIGGKTVVMNQLVQNGNFADSSVWFLSNNPVGAITVADNVMTYTATSTGDQHFVANVLGTKTDHVYYATVELKYNNTLPSMAVAIGSGGYNNVIGSITALNTWTKIAGLFTRTTGGDDRFTIYARCGNNQADDTINLRNVMCIDLTALLGAGNEPATAEEVEAMFPASYYPYNAGTLLSAGVTEVVSKDGNNATLQTISIPASIQALEGYGWSAGTAYNYIDYERKVFVKCVNKIILNGDNAQTINQLNWGGNNGAWTYVYSVTNNKTAGAWTNVGNVVCDVVPPISAQNIAINGAIGVALDGSTNNGICINIGNSSLTTAELIKTYLSSNPITVYYELATPQEIDISEYLTDDNLINVESGGTLTFPNQHGDDYRLPVPSEETYMIDLQEAINNG